MNLSASEQISYSTVRIEVEYNDGTTGTGTGFFFNFLEDTENKTHVPAIITNKHVIKNSKKGRFILTKANENGEPLDTEHYQVFYDDFESFWKKHKDKDVDLCAIPIANFLIDAEKKKVKVFYFPLNKNILVNKENLEEINALEEILMIGYPNGIWDNINNKPILRKGITASHPKFDYCGKKEIIIDAACFPGSSGSPVFIFNEGVFKTKTGRLSSGNRIILLGVLFAGPQHTATGEIEVVNVPTIQKPISISRIPNNLGLVIKAERILELEELFM
jgi:hypothetical protein